MVGLPIRCVGIALMISSIVGNPLMGIAGTKRCRCQNAADGRNAGQQPGARNGSDPVTVTSPFGTTAPQQNTNPQAGPTPDTGNVASDQRHTAINANLKASGKLIADMLRDPQNSALKAKVEAALKVETPPQSLVEEFLKTYP